MEDLTVLLKRCADGDVEAEDRVFELAYEQLKQLARMVFRHDRHHLTLQPSVLVNEAFLRMPRAGEIQWHDRQHFFAIAARAMRRTIIDHARQQAAAKRPHRSQQVLLDEEGVLSNTTSPEFLLLVDELLHKLAQIHPRRARVVEMRFFAGMTHEQVAAVLGFEPRTSKRDWEAARRWIYDQLTRPSP